ncbi:hypothetical protein SDC9_179904 [bioreactor metagenome]|uniref:Uncharacterized protein n=1 Tax=bioreactor metagenome TaxID=1076179 RepID=A0A645H1R5_9ZZZZ
MTGFRYQMIVLQITQRLMGKTMQVILVQPNDGLCRQGFIHRIGAHNVAQPRTNIRKPGLPRLRQFDLQPHRQRDGAVQRGAKAQTRIAFGDHFVRRQVGQGVRLFRHRLATQFTAGLGMRIATG